MQRRAAHPIPQLGMAAACCYGERHAVEVATRAGLGRVEITVGVEPDHAHVRAETSERSQAHVAGAPEHEWIRARGEGIPDLSGKPSIDLDHGLQVVRRRFSALHTHDGNGHPTRSQHTVGAHLHVPRGSQFHVPLRISRSNGGLYQSHVQPLIPSFAAKPRILPILSPLLRLLTYRVVMPRCARSARSLRSARSFCFCSSMTS